MDISDIATSEYRSVATDERLGSVRSILGTADAVGVLVTDAAADAVGVITTRDRLRSHYSPITATTRRRTRSVRSLEPGTTPCRCS